VATRTVALWVRYVDNTPRGVGHENHSTSIDACRCARDRDRITRRRLSIQAGAHSGGLRARWRNRRYHAYSRAGNRQAPRPADHRGESPGCGRQHRGRTGSQSAAGRLHAAHGHDRRPGDQPVPVPQVHARSAAGPHPDHSNCVARELGRRPSVVAGAHAAGSDHPRAREAGYHHLRRR
jgi:hypothetical protein